MNDLTELLETNRDETLILLHYYRWNRDQLENSDYFDNQIKIRKLAGLSTTETPSKKKVSSI